MVSLFHRRKIAKHLPTRSRKEITNGQFSKLNLRGKETTNSTSGLKEAQESRAPHMKVSLKGPAAMRSRGPVYRDQKQDQLC